MATVYRCDGCDTEFKERSDLAEVRIEIYPHNKVGNAYDVKRINHDFCTRCVVIFQRNLTSLIQDREEARQAEVERERKLREEWPDLA